MTSSNSPRPNGPLSVMPTPSAQTDKDDNFTEFASHMALVHNVIIRGYNSIYLQAPRVKGSDTVDFLHYCEAWYILMIGHHDSEESILFPGIEKATGVKGIMDDDIHEHETFRRGLDDFKTYLDTCFATPSEFSGIELVKILDSFGSTLEAHLTQEPLRLASLSQYDFDIKPLGDHTTDHAMQRYSTTDVLPILWYNLDTKFESGKWQSFPPLPAPVKWYMINVLGWWRGNWWRFGSCGANGAERELLCLRQDY